MKLKGDHHFSPTLSLDYVLLMIFLADCTYFFILKKIYFKNILHFKN